ncbi:fatty-acyl-CoA synthase [Roseinatronobacter thiooxidans]|uniref:Fatty-acyl-CoA synthase n=1 Tax=Roseinatronobacter thiooxidans TaxID=121821 RepID=A0A2W7QJ65_9RHOB|nr:acyl-CoA synthetase [Roseinatronobacter thiooxidans]PZX48151.1 fatty-acyl-CoA synthase [Roseinatronobacter thiooxidans]
MHPFKTGADLRAIEAESSWDAREMPVSVYRALQQTAKRHGARKAISFQMFAAPGAKAQTLTWAQLLARVTQAANLFRSLGVGESDSVAYILPTLNETAITLLGGMTAGRVSPINPLLEPEKIAALLRETGAKVVVTLRAFPKTDVAQKVAQAVALAPDVQTVLELDMLPHLSPPKAWIVPFIRPKNPHNHPAKVLDFHRELDRQPSDALTFDAPKTDRIAAYFHTGGTTGMPKMAQHRYGGMIYNGWLGAELIFTEKDVLLCPLPLFHVFAAYPILMCCIMSGAHVVFPTPQGYRGEGVFDNFWKLIERWGVTFMITVPTALSALMQRKVDANITTLRTGISGSAALPRETYKRFEQATGVQIAEGYGLTEATCLVSCNPVDGMKKIGSVGLPLPYTKVRIMRTDNGAMVDCATNEVGEICISSPGVTPPTYTEEKKNHDLYVAGDFLRTGDLGRVDEDGYLWITGRQKDLIIRGGHNIDPAEIEEALLSHPDVAFAGAIGQPDARSGELPCAYVELVTGARTTPDALLAHVTDLISERAAIPKHIEVLDELPKTAVGKVFKPDLRRLAIARVLDAALSDAKLAARVSEVVEDKHRGLVARIDAKDSASDSDLAQVLDKFTIATERV